MALTTAFASLSGVEHPIVLAPMGGSGGGALARAVSGAGGLGMVGAAFGDPGFIDRELPMAAGGPPWALVAVGQLKVRLRSPIPDDTVPARLDRLS